VSGSAAARDTLVISLLRLLQPAIPRPGAGTDAVERADHNMGSTAASSYPSPPHEPDGRHAAGIRARYPRASPAASTCRAPTRRSTRSQGPAYHARKHAQDVGAELTPENLPWIRPAITRADKIP
jgi:hypothetical protein